MCYSISTLLTGPLFIFPVLCHERAENSVLETQGARGGCEVFPPLHDGRGALSGACFSSPWPALAPPASRECRPFAITMTTLLGKNASIRKNRVNCKDLAILRRVLVDSEVSISLSR